MLGVGHSVTNDVLEEHLRNIVKTRVTSQQPTYLENTPGFLIDESADPFDATPPCKPPNCRLSNALITSIKTDDATF